MNKGAESSRVLLVGGIGGVFVDAESARRYPCEVAGSLLDGLDRAARGSFSVVGVVMDGTAGQLHSALRALRNGTHARIVLLARMYEEPVARRLVEQEPEGSKLADEYLVCPTRLAFLCDRVEAGASPEARADVARLERRLRYLEYLATTDDLTGLKNRRYVLEFARQVLDRAQRRGGRLTLLLFDIDNFKHYNDVCGHLAGDEILRQAGILMRRCCRPHDVVARIGGDEFAAVFWDGPHPVGGSVERDRRSKQTDHPAEAISVVKRFQEELGNTDLHLLGPGAKGELTISGALASFPRDGDSVQALFQRADSALLEAKRHGKNRIYLVGEPQSDIADVS